MFFFVKFGRPPNFFFLLYTKLFSINKNHKNKFLLWPFIKPLSFFSFSCSFKSHICINFKYNVFFGDCPNKKSTRWLSTLCILIFKTKFCKIHVSFVYTRVRFFLNLNASNYTTTPRNFGYIRFFVPMSFIPFPFQTISFFQTSKWRLQSFISLY